MFLGVGSVRVKINYNLEVCTIRFFMVSSLNELVGSAGVNPGVSKFSQF